MLVAVGATLSAVGTKPMQKRDGIRRSSCRVEFTWSCRVHMFLQPASQAFGATHFWALFGATPRRPIESGRTSCQEESGKVHGKEVGSRGVAFRVREASIAVANSSPRMSSPQDACRLLGRHAEGYFSKHDHLSTCAIKRQQGKHGHGPARAVTGRCLTHRTAQEPRGA